MSIRASLICTTYEMPFHLERVLCALLRQSTRNFEILLCDDGSGSDTQAIIQRYQKKFLDLKGISVSHLWQEHKGFRKCKILNQALRVAAGEIIIFLDGDCVPHKDYIRDHLEQQEPGRYLAGRRMEIGKTLAEKLTIQDIEAGYFDRPHWSLIQSVWRKDSEHLQRSIRIPWKPIRKLLKMDRVDDLKGCNYSVGKSDLLAINGFDESYEGYGREDTDVELRLQNLGLTIKSLKGLALQFHLWHPRREFTPANDDRLEQVKKTKRVRCDQGLQTEA